MMIEAPIEFVAVIDARWAACVMSTWIPLAGTPVFDEPSMNSMPPFELTPSSANSRLTSFAETPAVSPASALSELVLAYAGTQTADREMDCLANAVYFEARSEPIEGQLAVRRT